MGMINGIGIIGLCVFMISAVSSTSKNECLTIACKAERFRSSFSIISSMNEYLSPCYNFYDFACGYYEEPEDSFNHKSYLVLPKSNEDLMAEKLYLSIKKIDKTTETSRPRKLVKEFYDMCMHAGEMDISSIAHKRLLEIINNLHGFPMLENSTWNEENWRWEDVYNEAVKLGIPTDIFLLDVQPQNLEDQSRESLRLYNPKKAGMDESFFHIYSKFLEEYELDKNISEQQFQELVDFERNLSNMKFSGPPIETRANYARRNFDNIDWDKLFDLSAYGIEFDEKSELINLESIEYLHYLNNISVPKRVLANYQIMKFLQHASPLMRWNLNYDDQWKRCVEMSRKLLPHITDAIYIQDHFDKDIKKNVLEMTANIKEQFKKAINSISWLDQSAREFATAKLEATQYLVAYPDEMLDDEVLNEIYKDYEILTATEMIPYKYGSPYEVVASDILKTVLRFNFLTQKRKMLHYKTFNHTSIDALSSWLDSKTSNNMHRNIIRIPAGFLEDRNYNKYRFMSMNYATLGRQIAHEISRTFDKDGIFFDKDGDIKSLRRQGISDVVFQEYNNKTSCLTDQYNGYKYLLINEPMNDSATINEYIADVIGIRAAYHAYQEWVKKHGPEPSLPYLDLTPNLLFWISFAHRHCTRHKNSADVHVNQYLTNYIRVIGSASNSPEFADDFNCPINSKMNPTNKCL